MKSQPLVIKNDGFKWKIQNPKRLENRENKLFFVSMCVSIH